MARHAPTKTIAEIAKKEDINPCVNQICIMKQAIAIDLEDATQNLSENLHLKWNYGLLYIDKYSDDQGMPVSSISGLRRNDETQYYMRIQLITEQKSVYCRINIWRVITTGWPFPTGITSPSSQVSLKKWSILWMMFSNFVRHPMKIQVVFSLGYGMRFRVS